MEQTGLPYIYGYMLNHKDKHKIDAYLKGQQMLHTQPEPDGWGIIWGIFQIPQKTGSIRFFMQQADGSEPQNGSAARFDDPGIFIFDTEKQAKDFIDNYK